MTENQFKTWVERTTPQIEAIHQILSQRLSDEPESLIKDLQEVEAWNGRMGYLLADANSWLDWDKAQNIPSREGRTEFERKILLDKTVSETRKYRDIIESIVDSIKQRLILGMSILSYSRQFKEFQAKTPEVRNNPW